MSILRYILYTFTVFIFLTKPAISAITFTNGKWENSFTCKDWVHDYPSTLNCAGLQSGLNTCSGTGVVPCAGTDQSRGESILASANNPSGQSGTGSQVHYFFTGVDGTGAVNNASGGLTISFPQVLQEYWFRSYIYFPAEMGWGSTYSGWKTFYFDHGPTLGWYFGFPRGKTSSGFYFQTLTAAGQAGGAVESTGYGDDWLESNNRQGFGRWIPVEIHFKNNSGGAKGVVQVWVDGTLIINKQDHDFGVDGFRQILIGSNGTSAVAAQPSAINKAVGIRFDDIVIATPDYSGLVNDGNGNKRIGLLGSSTIKPPLPPKNVLLYK